MPVASEKIWSTEYIRSKLGGATWPSQANGNCQTSFSHATIGSRYPLGMRRYLLWAVVVHKYIPNAASYLQANQQPIFPNYCKWTAGPPLSFQVPSTVVSCPFWLAATASTDWLSRPDKITQVPSGNQASGLLYALLPKLAKAACAIIILAPGSNTVASSSVHRPAIPGIAMDCQVPVVLCCAVLCCTRYRRDKDEAVSICIMDQTDHQVLDPSKHTAAIPIHRPRRQAKQQMAGQDAAQA
ncbi:hypothetical protein M431DRAFT_531202 [Trichoderma harzianum CBS 226.95]|uniref:Uncharacterized protein n=1 Tax=Trichoderma harzianum CBS 226.95 TaxID=983964 RepID=A0A2T4AE48_TRIHA|nr:hypothetical protein M431DRAFT_531202 [Trichoderma harzianum CBS 226.95]PTB55198.1 hypothetical protein M431DRAFT_531202 [Trichoderma harzianum CBS 226.95]